MKQDKWTQQLHDKLAEHEMAAPEDLWADIEAALEQQPKPRKSRFVALRRWAAAATVAALMIGGGYLWWNGNDQKSEGTMAEATQRERPPVQANEPKEPETTPTREAYSPVHKKLAVATKTAIDSPSPMTINQPQETAEIIPADTIVETERPVIEKAVETENQAVVRELDRQIAKLPPAKTKQPLSLGLYAMNGLNNQSSSNGVLMADDMAKQFQDIYEYSYATAARISEPIYLTGYEERENHHRPISYGLTLSYPLTERLSLTTGVIYTKLVSDFTQVMRKTQIQREQTLHYVGIPVNLSFRLWAQNGFRAYVSAGTLAYWNVDTHLVTEGVTQKLPKDRMQWALNGSVGAQYDILPQLGLYVEPGLSWYPDNRSHIQNFFKDKPVNLSLQVGLRVNIK